MNRKINNKSDKKKWFFYACLIFFPLLQFAIMYVGVNFNSFLMSFQKYDTETNSWVMIGFDNFRAVFYDLFKSPDKTLLMSILNAMQYYATSMLFVFPLQLLFAYYIFKKNVGWKLFRIVLFIPSIVSGVVLMILFQNYFDYFIPNILNKIFGSNIPPLASDPATRFKSIVIFNCFISFGMIVLIYTGAMTGIPESVIEAGQLDGVNSMQEFFYLILPQIFGTVSVFLVTGIAGIFTNQLHLYTVYGTSYPDSSVITIGYYIYMNVQKNGRQMAILPYYACLSLSLTLVVAPLILTLRSLFKKIDPMRGDL